MLQRKFLPLLVIAMFLLGTSSAHGGDANELTPQLPLPYELVVLLDDEPGSPSPETAVEAINTRRQAPANLGIGEPKAARLVIPPVDRPAPDRGSAGDRLLRYIVLEYPEGAAIASVKEALASNPHVLWVDYNWPMEISAAPNDPYFAVAGTPSQYQWGLHSLKMPEAWDYNTGHAYVGIVDLGIDSTHPDFVTYQYDGAGNLTGLGNYHRQLAFDYGYPGDNCSAAPGNDCSGAPSKDCADEGQPQVQGGSCRIVTRAGHGTHVAGIVGAATNNGTGVTAACWSCSLVISKVSRLRSVTSGWSNTAVSQADAVAGMHGSITKGAQILNLSLGWRPTGSSPAPDCAANPSHILCAVMDFADRRDVVIAAASGNDFSHLPDFPASDPRAIGVGGVTSTGAFWNDCPAPSPECGGSNYFPGQILAPAKEVWSTFYRNLYYAGVSSTCVGFDPYGTCTGTSMAAPHIAGAAGVLRSVNPLLSSENVKYLLSSNLDNPPGWDPQYGIGKPHVANATKAALGKSAGAQLPNRLTPLFSLYSYLAEDSFYTTAPQAAAAALESSIFYQPWGPDVPGYHAYPGVTCNVGPCPPVNPTASVYVFTGERAPFAGAPPLVPLYRMTYLGTNPNGNVNHRDTTFTTELPGVKVFHAVGYEVDGIEGYIYKKCTPEPSCMPAGTVRLLRRYHPQRDDFAIFPENELAAMEGQGYVSTGGVSGVLGYVHANSDSDGDTLIDGFEGLAGTQPTVADSDCDGASDGQELLQFGATGYGDPRSAPGCTVPLASQFVSMSVPTTMKAHRVYVATMSFKNVGTQTWTPVNINQCGVFRMGLLPQFDNGTWIVNRTELTAPVPPGATTTKQFDVVAPAAAGTYNSFQWQMLQECVQWFGQQSPPTPITVQAALPKDSQFRVQTVPTTMKAGQTYAVSVRFRNVGSNTWNPVGAQCGAYRLGSWPMDNTIWGSLRHELTTIVAPDGAETIQFNVTAPATPGSYPFQWRMLHECVEWFGDLSQQVLVNVIP